jgi:hypothetical protein
MNALRAALDLADRILGRNRLLIRNSLLMMLCRLEQSTAPLRCFEK